MKVHRGFTIVELLIVIVVIAILSAITIVAYNGVTERARDAKVVSGLNQITKKIELAHARDDSFPMEAAFAADMRQVFAENSEEEWDAVERGEGYLSGTGAAIDVTYILGPDAAYMSSGDAYCVAVRTTSGIKVKTHRAEADLEALNGSLMCDISGVFPASDCKPVILFVVSPQNIPSFEYSPFYACM